jgi:hypothetical protein
MRASDGPTPAMTPDTGGEVHGHVSDVTGGQVAVGGRVFQIDAAQGSYVVINAESDVEVVRREPPVLRPPPAFPGLVARAAELRRIRTALDSGLSVEVHGPGGIGKTALLRAASNNPVGDSTPDGVVAIPARLGTSDTLSYVFDCCYVGSRRVVPRREELTTALRDLRLLVVLDDTSLTRDDISALREALPSSLLLLAGIEQRVFDRVEGVALGGLSVGEGVELIESALGRELSPRERDVGLRVSEVLHGSPLELVRFASLVRADDGDLVSVARGFGVDAQPQDLLVAVRRSVSVEEESVLAALAAFDAPVGAGPVAVFSAQAEAGALLLGLARRGLVKGDDLQGWRARDRTAAPPEDRHRAATALATWVRHRSVPEEVAGEIPAIASALHQAHQDLRWDDAVSLAIAAERPLALAGRWSAWKGTLESGLTAAGTVGDEANARFFAHQLAVMEDALAGSMSAPGSSAPPSGPPAGPPPTTTGLLAGGQPTPSPRLPAAARGQRRRKMIAGAAALLVLIGLGAGAAALLSSGDEPRDITTSSPSSPRADDSTRPAPVAAEPNVLVFTLGSEPAVLQVNEEKDFTVRAQNKPLTSRDVGPSQGGSLEVRIGGDAAKLVSGSPDCTLDSPTLLRCELPDLDVGQTADFAVRLVGSLEGGVTLSTQAQPSNATGPGTVAGRPFQVTQGPESPPCTLPNVIGMAVDDAVATLKEAGFTATTDNVGDAGSPPGTVIDQNPLAGEHLCGIAVTLKVSMPTPTPS